MARILADIAMDINNDFIRERSNSSSKVNSRSALVTSIASSVTYHQRMETNNGLPDEEVREPIDSSQLLYKEKNDTGNSVRKTTDTGPTRSQQHVQNEAPALKNTATTQGKSSTIPPTRVIQMT